MKNKKKEAVVWAFINDGLSLRQAQKKLKLASMTSVYVQAFHVLKGFYQKHK